MHQGTPSSGQNIESTATASDVVNSSSDATIATAAPSTSENREVTQQLKNFEIRRIPMNGLTFPIVLQNHNGPCPLLAIVNTLILKGHLNIRESQSTISDGELIEMVGTHLLTGWNENMDERQRALQDQNASAAVDLLPKIARGLDVNCLFGDCSAFEFTNEVGLFDTLGLELLHGWVYDPTLFGELGDFLKTLSYNTATALLYHDPYDIKVTMIQDWLATTQSQLTEVGLQGLNRAIPEGHFAVLFRNNHFHTIYKRDDKLWLLVTDRDMATQPNAPVWECLENIGGNNELFDADFKPIFPLVEPDPQRDVPHYDGAYPSQASPSHYPPQASSSHYSPQATPPCYPVHRDAAIASKYPPADYAYQQSPRRQKSSSSNCSIL